VAGEEFRKRRRGSTKRAIGKMIPLEERDTVEILI
jgi:hypothetical protein